MLFLPREEAVREFLELDETYFAQRSSIEYERWRKERDIIDWHHSAYKEAFWAHRERIDEADLGWMERVGDDTLR